MWDKESIKHEGFTDLGNYVIELPDYDDPSVQEKGFELINKRYDHGDISKVGCTAMIKRNSAGEVIVGRNMDIEVSQDPAYVYKTTYGKYKNFCVSYAPGVYKHYADIQKDQTLDENFRSLLIFMATDCFNEKGLYVENNMRTSYSELSNYGLHSARGEKNRADGTPWNELRLCTSAIPQLLTQNCATVDEALKYLENSYDFYTIGLPTNPTYDGWNYSFVIGDAAGGYGLIEIAQDEIHFIPYQFGQANFYLNPKWSVLDHCGSGYGRLLQVENIIKNVETLDEAMNEMKSIMWRNETLWIGESKRVDDETHPNTFNQIIFQDDKGNAQLDWRSDYVASWPVLDDGRVIVPKILYEQAKESDYDKNIKKYFDDAIERNTLVIDDGSITFEVNGERVDLLTLLKAYTAYEEAANDPSEQEKLYPYYKECNRLFLNQNSYWCHDDHNFEALKAMAYESLHTRYDENGEYDKTAMSKYEKLKAFYGYGTDKDETPLRNDAAIWTTSLNVGVNCAKKEIKIRFWENDNIIYEKIWE